MDSEPNTQPTNTENSASVKDVSKNSSSNTESAFETPRNSSFIVPDPLPTTITKQQQQEEEEEKAEILDVDDPEIDNELPKDNTHNDEAGQDEQKTETVKDRFNRFNFDEDEDNDNIDPTRSYTGSFGTADSNKPHIPSSNDQSSKSSVDESSMAGTTCCFICLLILIAIVLIASGKLWLYATIKKTYE